MSVLLYVQLKNDVFPISLPFPLYQGTLSLTNVVNSLVNFVTIHVFNYLCSASLS